MNRLQHETSPYLRQHQDNPVIGIRGAKKPLKKLNLKISRFYSALDTLLVIGVMSWRMKVLKMKKLPPS